MWEWERFKGGKKKKKSGEDVREVPWYEIKMKHSDFIITFYFFYQAHKSKPVANCFYMTVGLQQF